MLFRSISRSRLADAIAGAAMTTFTDSGASSEKDSSANLRLEAVAFASEVLRVPTADELDSTNGDALASAARIAFAKKDIDRLTEAVFSCANDPYYKLAAEGLRASACIVRRARPNTNDAVQDKEGCSVLASGSLERAISRLSQQDEDQEVKDASVTLLGDVLTHAVRLVDLELLVRERVREARGLEGPLPHEEGPADRKSVV